MFLWAAFRELLIYDILGQFAAYHSGESHTRDIVGVLCGFENLPEMTKRSQETAPCRLWQQWRLGEMEEQEMLVSYLLGGMEAGFGEDFTLQVDSIMGMTNYSLMMRSDAGDAVRVDSDKEVIAEMNDLVSELGDSVCLYSIVPKQ